MKPKSTQLDSAKSYDPAKTANKEENEFMSRMNNAKEDRKKRNVTFHGLPEVQEETTPRDGFYDQPKKNLLEVKDDDGAEF